MKSKSLDYRYPVLFMCMVFSLLTACNDDNCKNGKKRCDNYFALNYGQCGDCAYTQYAFYLRKPPKIEIGVDSSFTTTDTTGQEITVDTTFTRLIDDTLYHPLKNDDFPFVFTINNTATILNQALDIPLNSCLPGLPHVVNHKMWSDSLYGWYAISADSSKIFSGSAKANPQNSCVLIQINLK